MKWQLWHEKSLLTTMAAQIFSPSRHQKSMHRPLVHRVTTTATTRTRSRGNHAVSPVLSQIVLIQNQMKIAKIISNGLRAWDTVGGVKENQATHNIVL